MWARWRELYTWLRTVPVLGLLATRAVWGLKGALGRPVIFSQGAARPTLVAPAPQRRVRERVDIEPGLKIALAAVEALQGRVAALEAGAAAPTGGALEAGAPAAAGPARSVSVVVSTLDRAAWLDRALAALAYQRHPAFEVIVVAGPSGDDTDAVLARHADGVRVVRCAEANLSRSRNLGLAAARGDLVAFLDDDAAPEPDWLDALTAAFADAAVGGVGGYIRDHTGVDFQCKAMVADRYGRAAEAADPQRPDVGAPGPGVERFLSLTGTNCAFRRGALLAIGGFDEAYAYFLDETDVCLRLAEAAWRLVIAPAAEVHHAYAQSAQRDAVRTPRRLLDCARSSAYFTLRNAAPRYGLGAAAERLAAYAETQRRDTLWRCDHGLVQAEGGERMLAEVDRGIAQGVRLALGAPRRLGVFSAKSGTGDDAGASVTPWFGAPPTIRLAPSRLRLCLLSQDYPQAHPGPEDALAAPPGGIAIWTQALAQALAARGHEVSVLARAGPERAGVAFHQAGRGGVWVHRVAAQPARRPRRAGLLCDLPASVADPALAVAEEVLRVDPRRRFDAVMGPLWDLEPMALLERGAWPVAVSLHTTCAQLAAFKPQWDLEYRRTHVDRVIAGERRLLAAAPHVLANSIAALSDIASALHLPDLTEKTEVIAHGLPDLAHGVAPAARGAGVEVLFVGRLERRKGIDVLLEAAPRLLESAPDVRLTVVGEEAGAPGEPGFAEAFMRRWAGAPWLERVSILGPLPRAALLARYAASDIVVMPSRYESFGLVALEAMVFAKPCVVGDAGGLGELVVDGETGLCTPPGDAGTLAAALLALAADRERRVAMGAAGRRRYEAHFTADAMADAAERWFGKVATGDRVRLAAE